MMVFDLVCSKGHNFREWFSGNTDYDARKKDKRLICPSCGDKDVSKAIMAPNVKTTSSAPEPQCGQATGGCAAMGCPGAGIG